MSIEIALMGDRLVVVEGDLGAPAEQTPPLRAADLKAAEEAAAQCSWIVRHQPFAEDNREIGHLVMCKMLEEAGLRWPRPDEDDLAIEKMLTALEAGTLSEAKFVDWVCLRVATA